MARTAAVSFDAPQFPVAAALVDPERGAAEAAARRRDQAYVEGYEAGMSRAEAEVEQAIADHRHSATRFAELCGALERATDDLAVRDRLAIADIEHDVVTLAVTLAEELVGRELSTIDEPVIDALARAVELVPDRGTPTVRVHPDDAETAREAVDADVVRWSAAVTVAPDPRVERGGCVVDVGPCRIDAQLTPALDRLKAALSS